MLTFVENTAGRWVALCCSESSWTGTKTPVSYFYAIKYKTRLSCNSVSTNLVACCIMDPWANMAPLLGSARIRRRRYRRGIHSAALSRAVQVQRQVERESYRTIFEFDAWFSSAIVCQGADAGISLLGASPRLERCITGLKPSADSALCPVHRASAPPSGL